MSLLFLAKPGLVCAVQVVGSQCGFAPIHWGVLSFSEEKAMLLI